MFKARPHSPTPAKASQYCHVIFTLFIYLGSQLVNNQALGDLMDNTEFSKFIERTSFFQEEVGKIIAELSPVPNARFITAFQSGQLAFEHSIVALQLIKSGLLPSGYSLFRPQFESLVRGIWLLHAASDSWVDKLSQPLTVESANKANEGPNLIDMLIHLEKSEAPMNLVSDLKEFKSVTWKILNSYIHGGLHPISRTITGYPTELTFNA